ncbi:MAG: hypothetical protein EON93_00645 [Burkholderiales bacterium]|nr:MAG: hypothetical protein EON93_00645 [Burkholderiales bacterium]
MSILVSGAIVMACAVIGLYFLRFWKSSRDSFFLYFAAAFWIQGAQWLYTGVGSANEYGEVPYLARLLAYLLIVVAILQKNFTNRETKAD